jgi:predicted extracellular nuclease
MPRPLAAATVAVAVAVVGAVGLAPTSASAAPTELFISEYAEGTSNNKAIELFNGTGAPVDLTTGAYSVQMYFNGSSTAGLTINLTGTVTPGDVFVLAQASAAPAILAQADQTNGAGWFNGNDAVVLRRGTTIVDSVGQVGVDPPAPSGAAG